MPRSNNVHESVHDSPPDEPSKGKQAVRYSMHILHLTIADLLFICIILSFVSWHEQSFLLFYLFPFIFYITAVEFYYIFGRQPPKKLIDGIYGSRSLRIRSFHYQFAGAFAIGFVTNQYRWRGDITVVAIVFAIIVLVLGILLYILALVARECGFEDWIQEPEPQGTLRLHDEESAEDIGYVQPSFA